MVYGRCINLVHVFSQHATHWTPHLRLQEKEKWEEEVYRSFDSATGDLLESERPGRAIYHGGFSGAKNDHGGGLMKMTYLETYHILSYSIIYIY